MADLFNTLNTQQPPQQQASQPIVTAQSPPPNHFQENQMYLRKNKSFSRLRVKVFGVLAVMLILVGLPLFLLATRKPQEVRQRAAGPNTVVSQSCGVAPADIMLIIDRSSSMNATIDNSGNTKITAAKKAAQQFVDIISANTNNRIGLVTFSNTGVLNAGLTNNFASVKTAIQNISLQANTCTQCGIDTMQTELVAHGRTGVKKITILLTDGIANWIEGWGSTNHAQSQTLGESSALTATATAFSTTGVNIYTIGLGNDVNSAFLQQIASTTSAQYYFTPDTTQLNSIYTAISQVLGKGTISGFVFNDTNGNYILDTAIDQILANWTVDLKDSNNTNTIAQTTSDATGAYSFTNVCDGSYVISEEPQTGWQQNTPQNPNYYSITLANGQSTANNNLGNIQNNACGASCTTNTDCSNSVNGCIVCDTTTHTCSVPPSSTPSPTPTLSPTPTACSGPGTVSNLRIVCPDCNN